MSLFLKGSAEHYWQENLAKFDPSRKPDELDNLLTNGMERAMYEAGYMRAIEMLNIRHEEKIYAPANAESAGDWANWLKKVADIE